MGALHPDLKGRVAVVTGASRGIGKALALRLAREGADAGIAAWQQAPLVLPQGGRASVTVTGPVQ